MAGSFPKPLRYPRTTASTQELGIFKAAVVTPVIDVLELIGKGDADVVAVVALDSSKIDL